MKISKNKDLERIESDNKNNNLNLDLFRLHIPKEDIKPISWVCFKGKYLHKIFFKMFIEVQNSLKISRRKLISIIANSINCGKTCVSDRVYNVKDCFPIIMIERMLLLWKNHLNENNEQFKRKKLEIIKNTEFLKQNHPKAREILAVKKISPLLCKLAGAHAADGTLLKYYSSAILKLAQKDERYALLYSRWIKSVFNFEPCINIEKKCYSVRVYNKMISRYFYIFLDFPYGVKSKNVIIPKIIKNSNIKYQRAFACGVMTYEGSVQMDGAVSYGGLSKSLRNDLVNILFKSGLNVVSRDYKNKVFLFRTHKLSMEDIKKWLDFFAEDTEKWWKLKDKTDNRSPHIENIKMANKILDSIYSPRYISISKLIDVVEKRYKNKIIKSKDIQKEIISSNGTAILLMNILKRMNILIPKKQGIFIDQELHSKVFNETRLRPKEIAKRLKVRRKDVQHWKDRDCSIPLIHFKRLIRLAKMSPKDIDGSIRETYDGKAGYVYNSDFKTWKLPYRPWFKEVYS